MKFIRFIKETTFVVTREEKTVISMQTIVIAKDNPGSAGSEEI